MIAQEAGGASGTGKYYSDTFITSLDYGECSRRVAEEMVSLYKTIYDGSYDYEQEKTK